MKVIESTPDRLVLRTMPWIKGSLFVAIMIVIGHALWQLVQAEGWYAEGVINLLITLCGFGAATAIFIRCNELVLDRKCGTIQFRQITVFGRSFDEFDLNLLEQASTQTSNLGDGKKHLTYRVALILKDHPKRDPRTHPTKDIRPVTSAYSGGKDAANTAKTINAWLNRE